MAGGQTFESAFIPKPILKAGKAADPAARKTAETLDAPVSEAMKQLPEPLHTFALPTPFDQAKVLPLVVETFSVTAGLPV